MRFCKIMLLLAILGLILSACGASNNADITEEEMFMEDIDSIAANIQAMYDDIRSELLYDPDVYIAFADIDFDGMPEFFYGYHTMTGSHNKIWYRAYSLRDHAIISTEHSPNWHTYIDDDKNCAFYTGPKSFLEGYFTDDNAESNIITQTYAGPVTDSRLDVNIIKYKDSKLFVTEVNWSEVNWHDENLMRLKQAWSITKTDSVKDDAVKLLNEYSVKDAV